MIQLTPGLPDQTGPSAGLPKHGEEEAFAEFFGKPLRGSVAEPDTGSAGDALAGIGVTWAAVYPAREPLSSADIATPPALTGVEVGQETPPHIGERQGKQPEAELGLTQPIPAPFPQTDTAGGKAEAIDLIPMWARNAGPVLNRAEVGPSLVTHDPGPGQSENPRRDTEARSGEIPSAGTKPARGQIEAGPGGKADRLAGAVLDRAAAARLSGPVPPVQGDARSMDQAAIPPTEVAADEGGQISQPGSPGVSGHGPDPGRAELMAGGTVTVVGTGSTLPNAVVDSTAQKVSPAAGRPTDLGEHHKPKAALNSVEAVPKPAALEREGGVVEFVLTVPAEVANAGPAPAYFPMNGEVGSIPASHPASTAAERLWFGRLQWPNFIGAESGRGHVQDAAARPIAGNDGATAPGRSTPVAAVAGAAESGSGGPLVEPAVLDEPLAQFDAEFSALAWSPAGSPSSSGGLVTGPLPSGAIPQLASGIAATLHQRTDGTTEIALSPDELGSVRLRLEADARDPERMIVHLAFDRPETMDLFRRHADQLSEAIRAAGYAEAKLDFGQRGTGPGAGGQDTAGSQHNTGDGAAANMTDREPRQPVRDSHLPLRLAELAGLDLRL